MQEKKEQKSSEKPFGVAFDMDGCLFNENYLVGSKKDGNTRNQKLLSISKKPDVIDANRILLDSIKEIGKNPRVYSFSKRQAIRIDRNNTEINGTESSYTCLLKVNVYLNGTVEPVIQMTDIYNDLKDGSTFQTARNYLKRNSDYSLSRADFFNCKEWLLDDSKFSTLYVLIHNFAIFCKNNSPKHNPPYRLYVYDDLDLLDVLYDFLQKNPQLIPKSVELYLVQYNGKILKEFSPIHGTGKIDENYRKTILYWAELCIANAKFLSTQATGKKVTTLEEARQANFNLTDNVDFITCLKGYESIPVKEPVKEPKKKKLSNPVNFLKQRISKSSTLENSKSTPTTKLSKSKSERRMPKKDKISPPASTNNGFFWDKSRNESSASTTNMAKLV